MADEAEVVTEADLDASIELLKDLERLMEGKRMDYVLHALLWLLARILVERQPDDGEAFSADLKYILGGLNHNIEMVRLMHKSKVITVN
jgi:hypothetical protein